MRGRRWREGLCVVAVLLLATACAFVAYARPARVVLDVGGRSDLAYVEGFHAAEDSGTFSYRWSGEQATIRLRAIGRDRPLWLGLEIAGRLDSQGQPIVVTLSLDDQVLARFPLEPLSPQRSRPLTFAFAVAPRFRPAGDLVVTLESPTFSPGGMDTRQLGLVVDRATLLYGGGWGCPPLVSTLSLLALGLVVYASVRLASWSDWTALILAGGVLLLLTVALVAGRQWVAPYLPAFAGAVGIVGLFLLLARTLARVETQPLPQLFVALALFAPLFLWWQYTLVPIVLNRRDFLPLTLPVLAGVAYLGAFLASRFAGGEGEKTGAAAPRNLFAGAALALVLVYGVLFLWWVFSKDYASDFHALFDGVREFFVSRGSLYNLEGIRQNHLGALYKYPPFFSLVLLPLARVPFVPALQVWRVVNLILLCASVWLVAREYRFGRNLWLWAGVLFVLLSWRPLVDTLAYGQVDLLLLLPIVGTLVALRRGKGWLAGFLLALAAMFKLYPAFLALFFLLRREWRALLAFVLSLLLLFGLSVAILGWPVHATYLREVLPGTGGGTAWVENQTLNGLFNRLLTDRIALLPETDPRADLAALVVSAVLVLVTSWLIHRLGDKGTLRYGLAFSLLIVTMLLVLPAAWIHYQAILILPFILLFVHAREGEAIPFRAIALVGLAYGLLCFGNAWSVFERKVYGRFWQLLLSYKVYGMLFLWLGLAVLLWRGRRGVGAAVVERRPARPSVGADGALG